MKNKSWHDNLLRGKDRSILMKAWHNKMPKRWLSHDVALRMIVNSNAWNTYYSYNFK